ncbi:MAG: hypothetical protein KAQ62_03715, partial [Cyclobacteriaceae bacterium]|nr:hypothetical protein [Cyclobacteriaceae bacterium]
MKNIFQVISKLSKCAVLLAGLLMITNISSVAGDEKFKNTFLWEEIAPIPAALGEEIQHGLAAPFAGFSNGAIIVAGGCNFPDAPVYEGGIKKYYNDIFVYDEDRKEWIKSSIFPYPVAYGASVTIGKGVLCIGGNNQNQSFALVHLLTWDSGKKEVRIQEWPALPYNMTNMAAALVDNKIFVAGGKADDQLANKFLSLNLSKIGSDEFQWV